LHRPPALLDRPPSPTRRSSDLAPEHLGLAVGSGIRVFTLCHGMQKGKQADDGAGPFDDEQNPIRGRKHAPSLRGYRTMLPQRPVGCWGYTSAMGDYHPSRQAVTDGSLALLVVGLGVLLRGGPGVRRVPVRLRRTTGLRRASAARCVAGLRGASAARCVAGLRGTARTRCSALAGSGAVGLA